MNTTVQYTYNRADGGTVECYGDINDAELINFSLTCENEYWDELVEFETKPKTWASVCNQLADTINNLTVEEIVLI